MSSIVIAWKNFWFNSYSYENFRLFQILFGVTVFVLYFFRLLDYSFIYSNSGILPYESLSYIPESFNGLIPFEWLAKNDFVGILLHILFLILLLLMVFNFQNRYLLIAIWILHLVFMKRNPIAVYGVDMVVSFWFLYSALMSPKCNKAINEAFNSVAYRMIQLQICIIYAYSGFDKAMGLSWWRGDALWFAYSNPQLMNIDFSFLVYTPWILAGAATITLLWEVYFPVFIWVPQIRKWILSIGLIFHLGIAITMNLLEFSAVMLAAYLLFLDRNTAKYYLEKIETRFSLYFKRPTT